MKASVAAHSRKRALDSTKFISITPPLTGDSISREIAKIFKRNGISIDRRCEPAAVCINPKVLRTPEKMVAAFELGNLLKALMNDQADRRTTGAGAAHLANRLRQRQKDGSLAV
jgi:hypothetical protein